MKLMSKGMTLTLFLNVYQKKLRVSKVFVNQQVTKKTNSKTIFYSVILASIFLEPPKK